MNQKRLDDPFSRTKKGKEKPTESSLVRLRTYLASPLTGLSEDQEGDLFGRQDQLIKICKENNIEIHAPRDTSHPTIHMDLPSDVVRSLDREKVLHSDFLIVMTDLPSHGVGMEVEMSVNALVPIILLRPKGQATSRMLLGIPSLKYEVEVTGETLEKEFLKALQVLRPVITKRREWIQRVGQSPIGSRIRNLRREIEGEGSLEAFAKKLGLAPEELRYLEEKNLQLSNPSILLLRRIADLLEVSLAELVDPQFVQLSSAQLVEDLVSEHAMELAKARFGIRREDYRRIMRRKLNAILGRL